MLKLNILMLENVVNEYRFQGLVQKQTSQGSENAS